MKALLLYCCLTVLLLTGLIICTPAVAEVNESDHALAEQVFQRLLVSVQPPTGLPWPPKLEIIDKDEINAFATMRTQDGGQYPVVVCYNGLLKQVVEGNADRIAYVLGIQEQQREEPSS
jgi:Zn-dependent protease with chaperone function